MDAGDDAKAELARHKLRQLLDAALVATVNPDDPACFGGYMNENFTQTLAAVDLNAPHACTLARNRVHRALPGPAE